MKLVWKSHKINNPSVNLVQDMRNTIRNYYIKGHENQYVIKMGSELYKVLHDEIYPSTHSNDFMGIEYIVNNSIEDGCYCIYRKDTAEGAKKTLKEWKRLLGEDLICNPEETIPIKLTPVKTLDEWFTNLPLIYKIDLYNSMSGTITKHLK